MSTQRPFLEDGAQLLRGIAVLNARIIGLATGAVCGLGLLVATNWLVLKGGEPLGPHLSLLAQFFPGYSVSFGGSLVGAAYGLAAGFVAGLLLGALYNAFQSVLGERRRERARQENGA